MIYLLAIPFVAMIVLGCFYKKPEELSDARLTGIILGALLLLALLIGCGVGTLCNGTGLAEWQAFYTANADNYSFAVDKTASYLSAKSYRENLLVEGSIEKFKQASYVNERITEWRNAVNRYNTTIASMKYFDSNIFTGILVPDAVQDMKLLVIK